MAKLDWKQPATLRLLDRRGAAPGVLPVLDGAVVSKGSLADAMKTFLDLSQRDRQFARLEVAFGFHLDGLEILALKEVMPGH